jgi:hypothetical protein
MAASEDRDATKRRNNDEQDGKKQKFLIGLIAPQPEHFTLKPAVTELNSPYRAMR